jgi:hypothetical protein
VVRGPRFRGDDKRRQRRRGDPDRIGPTELARREKRRGRRPARDRKR